MVSCLNFNILGTELIFFVIGIWSIHNNFFCVSFLIKPTLLKIFLSFLRGLWQNAVARPDS